MTGRIRLSSFAQIYNKRQHFPFHVERAQSLFADIFIFGYDDDADFGPFLVGEVAQKTLGRSHPAAATQVLDVLVFPGDDIDDSRDGPGFRGVDAT